HALGLKIIIDLVANHTSWDSKILRQHPDWFTKDSTGAIVSPVPDWSDVADLDYSKPALREYMIRMLEYWVRDVGIDGFRCDVAEMVPTDFWNEARAALDRIKPVFMLSEGQYPEHHLKAFDATYGWPLYHLLGLMTAGEKGPRDLDTLLIAEVKNFPKQSIRMRFSSNHDENAWDNPDVVKFGVNGAKMAAVLVSTFPGIPLLYNGQEAGSPVKLSLFEKVPIDWNAHPEFREFYTRLFEVRKTHPALSATGAMTRLEGTDSTHVYSFMRTQGNDRVVVVINLSPSAYSTRFMVPGAKRQALRLTPLVSAPGLQTAISGREASVSLPGLGYAIYRVE
ncbi:MAG TPA: alpha-amylase family glycosyl hydrolase, partial [Bacteroidota bacterium]|nr:alpha-amylase family glycosyl hydrolase [Bacteroidota bacterium]